MLKISTLLTVILLFSISAFCQTGLPMRTGTLPLQPVASINLTDFYKQQTSLNGRHFVALQFSGPLTGTQRAFLQTAGITLQSYIPPYGYTAVFTTLPSKAALQQAGITAMGYVPAALKISPTLLQPGRYNLLQGNNGQLSVLIKISSITVGEAIPLLQAQQVVVQTSGLENFAVVQGRMARAALLAVAANPFVEWIEPAHPEDKPLNSKSFYMSGANVAQAPVSAGGYGLSGAGVVAGVGDDGNPSSHIDLVDRIIERSGFVNNAHGTHVSGTLGGAGIYRFLSRGIAPAATIISQVFGGIWLNAAQYVNDFGMVVTNNSYGNIVGDPTYEGVYDIYSQILDQQAFLFPELLHVFASGNDGRVAVTPYPTHYGTILSGYQSAKNTMTVGRTDVSMYASTSSSSGPVQDGRLKPEMVALGEDIISPVSNNGYGPAWGTSQAAPAVTGGAVLLTEQYRRQFGGANPKSSLIKALLMNGGLDIGSRGPDFRHGYGTLLLPRSLHMLKNNQFYSNSIATGSLQTQTIAVPPNTGQLKILLYWHDPAAALYAVKTLVNDIDAEVVTPAGTVVLPQKLDTIPANVQTAATTGTDHINNSEQIVINNPAPGNYIIRVKGFAINVNPTQDYVVAYDFLPLGLQIYAPFEGDAYFPGEQITIHWMDNGTTANTRTLEYSTDDGTTWTLIDNNISESVLAYRWNIPGGITPTTTARIRISENNTTYTHVSGKFVLLGAVPFSFAPASEQCEGYSKIVWSAVSGATDYEVLMKKGPDMQPVGTTTATNFTVSGLSKDSVYWFSVLPRMNGIRGKRSDGQPYQPSGGGCSGSISNGDVKLNAVLSPATGRRFTSSELSSNSTVSIQVKNVDDAPVADYDVKYSINGGPFASQHITTPIAAGSTAIVNFTGINLSAVGTYHIIAVVKNTAGDVATKNDTLHKIVKQLANDPIVLSPLFIENFESADSAKYESTTMGLAGLDRWDFVPLTANNDTVGRARTFVNSGIAIGNRAITLDVKRFVDNTNLGTNVLTGTFNLSNYNAATQEVRLDFMYKQHGTFQHDAAVGKNRVGVKGTETAPVQEVYNLEANQPPTAGQWRRTESIEISDALIAAGQNFTTSTQVTFTQTSPLGMGDNTHFAGYTFDDVRLYTVNNDVQAIAIDSPAVNSCALGTMPVRIRVKNSMSYTISNIPVKLSINGTTVATETIPSIAPNTTITYTFATPASFSTTGNYLIKAWVDLPADDFRQNDTANKTIYNQPVIASFPYLEDFESSNGTFYTAGQNSSWQYGQPNGGKIRSAASGTKAWKTSLQAVYNDDELSYLYTPCYNVSGLTSPTISFAMAYDIEYCRPNACDGAWVEYSTDGQNWSKLGSAGNGTNWYNYAAGQFWDSAKTHWHVATTALPAGAQNLRLRFVIYSDLFTTKDGVAIDDIHIYDRTAGIYSSSAASNLITQNVSGTGIIPFTDNGQIIATLLPNGENLGSTGVKAWMHTGPVRNNGRNYFANRNLTVHPSTLTTTTPVGVRFYFTDAEADSLRLARGCATCNTPKDYTFIGITKYNDTDDTKENGTMDDNQNGMYSYFSSAIVRKIPYDKGYYAEVGINSFSELWLNDGTPPNNILPIQWAGFTARITTGSNVLLQWTLENEDIAQHYEVEVLAPGSNAGFRRIAIIPAVNQQPQSRYTYTDAAPGKQGVYQYRIKRTDRNGNISYSEVRIVMFGNKNLNVVVYPNPATTAVQVLLQGLANSAIQVQLYDAAGKLLVQQNTIATGTAQKVQMNVAGLPAGLYQLKIRSGNEEEIVKLIKAE